MGQRGWHGLETMTWHGSTRKSILGGIQTKSRHHAILQPTGPGLRVRLVHVPRKKANKKLAPVRPEPGSRPA